VGKQLYPLDEKRIVTFLLSLFLLSLFLLPIFKKNKKLKYYSDMKNYPTYFLAVLATD